MKKLAVTIGLIACSSVFSNPSQSLWLDVHDGAELHEKQQKAINQQALKRRALSLDETGLKEILTGSDFELAARPASADEFQSEIDLPLPEGGFVRVRAINSPILSPEMAVRYPEIKTWRVEGVDNPNISGRLDFTSKGFHGMLSMPDGDIIYIDPDNNNTANLYHSLSKHDNSSHFKTDFNCEVHGDNDGHDHNEESQFSAKKLAQIPALDLITYRLAVAGTGEYTASQGGTQASAYASMVTTINRVNQVYRRDLGITMQIVSGDSFAYTDASTDPYTNNNASALIAENIQNINSTFGAANYDVGHVFAQGSLGGLAYVGVACLGDYKAGGATGIPNPQGETFSIEYVAHEMGHQLGGTHTFNSTQNGCGGGTRTQETAVEPGSGSTIMSYSGLCGSDNLQYGSDATFHWASIDQINSYTRAASGSSCGTRSATTNQKPVANAGADITVPLNTPFLLDGSSTGGSSYSWDQTDTGSPSPVDVDLGNNAIIRSLLPASNPDRYIPRLSDLFAGTKTIGEKLPQTVRDLNFALVVRDGSGGIGTDFKKVSVKDTGSIFSVLSHSTSQTLSTGTSIDVAWNVAGTHVAPINCSNVDIQLLRVNGVTNMLLANTENDGSQQLVIPNTTPTMTGARIMVACSDRSFFQISSGNVAIQIGSSDTTAPVITITGNSSLSITQGSNYIDSGATALDNIDGVLPVSSSGSVNTAVAGTYMITYSATDTAGNSATAIRTVTVTAIADTTPPVITLNGTSIVEVEKGSTYTDAGASASDNIDSVVSVTSSGTVNTEVVGEYTITYTATDAAGNTSTKERTVRVVAEPAPDTKAPAITLLGVNPVSVAIGSSYIELGAIAQDDHDGNVGVVITGTVDVSKVGSYTITYVAKDTAGNTAIKTRTVNVTTAPDETAPVITLTGNTTINLEVGQDFTDPGYNAFDDRDGIVSVTVSGAVDTSKVGTYVLIYTAVDAAGNVFTEERTVIISEVEEDNAEHSETSSSGGSIGYLLLPLAIIGLRRRAIKLKA